MSKKNQRGRDERNFNNLFGRGPAAAPHASDRRSMPAMNKDDQKINDLFGAGAGGHSDRRNLPQPSMFDDQALNNVMIRSAPTTPWPAKQQFSLSEDRQFAVRPGSTPAPSRNAWDDGQVRNVFARGAERQRASSRGSITGVAADDSRLMHAFGTIDSAGYGGACAQASVAEHRVSNSIFIGRPAPELAIETSQRGSQPSQTTRVSSDVIKQIARQLHIAGVAPQSVFDAADISRDGVLSKVELYQLLPRYEPSLTVVDLDSIFREFDRDGSGHIQLSEFVSALDGGVRSILTDLFLRISQSISQAGCTPEYIFEQLDLDHDGKLSRIELQRFILHHQPNIYQSEFDAVFAHLDKRNCGYVDVQVFCAAFGGGPTNHQSEMAKLSGRLAQVGISPHRFFMHADASGTGRISRLELEQCLRRVAPGITADEVQRVLQESDPGYTNYVDLFDFASILTKETPWCSEVVLQVVRSMARLGNTSQQLFLASSMDGTLTLDRAALSEAIRRYVPAVSSMDLEALFNEFDVDRSGRIDMHEFTSVLDGAQRSLPADTLVQITQQASLMAYTPEQLFAVFDGNCDGRLSREEFQQGVFRVKQDLFAADIESLFRDMERSGAVAGFVELGDFTTALQLTRFSPRADLAGRLAARIKAAGTTPQQLFMDTDFSGDAQLDQLEFEQMLNRLLPGLQPMEIHKLFRDFDTDASGSVDLKEFCDVLRGHGL